MMKNLFTQTGDIMDINKERNFITLEGEVIVYHCTNKTKQN